MSSKRARQRRAHGSTVVSVFALVVALLWMGGERHTRD